MTGQKLAEDLSLQAQRFGTEVIQPVSVTGIKRHRDGCIAIETEKGVYHAHAVIIASGVDYKRLFAKGEKLLMGRGVHYCATCDGPFYKGKKIAVVGGGNTAAQETIFLAGIVQHVTMIVRSKLKASKILIDRLEQLVKEGKLKIILGKVAEFVGQEKLEHIIVVDSNGKSRKLLVDGVFLFIGLKPNTEFLKGSLALDRQGFVMAKNILKTSMKGVLVAGDVRAGSTKQLASAVGEGAAAALEVRAYLDARGYGKCPNI